MKNSILATLVLLPIASYANDTNVKAYCDNIYQHDSVGAFAIRSEHGVTIINKTPITQTYRVEFDNAIQYTKSRIMPLDYSAAPYTPNAHVEYDIVVQPNQTYHYGAITIAKDAYFYKRGNFNTQATTKIKIGAILLDKCEHYTNVDIS